MSGRLAVRAVSARQASQIALQADRVALRARCEEIAALAVADGTVIGWERCYHGLDKRGGKQGWVAIRHPSAFLPREMIARTDAELIVWAEDVGIIEGPGSAPLEAARAERCRRPAWVERSMNGVSADAYPDGIDPMLWDSVEAWLIGLVNVDKQNYARAYCAHCLGGHPEPADPGADWAEKARRRADKIMRVAEHG